MLRHRRTCRCATRARPPAAHAGRRSTPSCPTSCARRSRACATGRAGPFTVAFAAFAALLHRYGGATDLCAATRFADRSAPGTERLLGAFGNTVVLRCDLGGDPPFRELVRRVDAVVLGAEANREFPFPELARVVNPRERSRPPARVAFSRNASLPSRVDFAGRPARVAERAGSGAHADLDVVLRDGGDGLSLLWEYDVEAFDAATMRRMLGCYLRLLAGALADPGVRLADLPLLGADQRRRILTRWRGDTAAPPPEPLVHDSVERRARAVPDAEAVRDGDGALTYAQLDGRADGLAACLRNLGAGPDRVVGVLLPRGAALVVAELGVLKAGAAYLPLDPDDPPARLTRLCADAGCGLVVTTAERVRRVPEAARPVPLDPFASGSCPTAATARTERGGACSRNLAYVMFTSGSTGRPKGVMVEHAALANYTGWYRREYGLSPGDRVAMANAPGFDASVMDVWPALTAGACVCAADEETRLSPRRLRDWLLEHRIAVAALPPALTAPLLDLPGRGTRRCARSRPAARSSGAAPARPSRSPCGSRTARRRTR
ncbi:AMP-binding protein [Actinomadura yumaensis]|uniref:AMP-binding protein n=1 Tax=Actinomadura yumaensis TaxID=111807 RepID=UPI003618D5DA